MNNKNRKQSSRNGMKGFGSLIRICIVAAICFAGVYFAMYHEDKVVPVFNESKKTAKKEEAEKKPGSSVEMTKDALFEPCYIMISNASDNGIKTTATPTDNGTIIKRLKNGTIVKAVENGTNNGVAYYKLEDGSYLIDEDEYVLQLKSYTKLSGYVVITFVSATGVKLRSWANFNDDNVAKRVFVGDQVQIIGKVVMLDDQEAYQTEDGYYMTTDEEYFDSHIQENPEEEENLENEENAVNNNTEETY